jgi:hypothetical protein
MRLDTALLLAVLAVLATPAAGLAAAPKAPAEPKGPTAVTDKGIRFELPAGFAVRETTEREPGEPEHALWVATKGLVEIRVEVEDGLATCDATRPGAAVRAGKTAAGLPTCEADLPAPPSLDPAIGARRATSMSVQYPGRHLSVVVFAPDQAAAAKLARQVAATAALEKN